MGDREPHQEYAAVCCRERISGAGFICWVCSIGLDGNNVALLLVYRVSGNTMWVKHGTALAGR